MTKSENASTNIQDHTNTNKQDHANTNMVSHTDRKTRWEEETEIKMASFCHNFMCFVDEVRNDFIF